MTKRTGIGERQRGNQRPHPRDRLRRIVVCSTAAHVRSAPSGVVEQCDDDIERHEFRCKRSHYHVHRGFAAAVCEVAAGSASNRSEPARDRNDLLLCARCNAVDESLGHAHRAHGIDAQHLGPRRVVHLAEVLPPLAVLRLVRAEDAGIVDQDVDRDANEFVRGALDGSVIRYIDFDNPQLGMIVSELFDVLGFTRIPAGSDDAPAVAEILSRELEAEATIGTCDQYGRHGRILC